MNTLVIVLIAAVCLFAAYVDVYKRQVDDISISPVQNLFGNMDNGTALGVDVVIPAQKVAFHAPAVEIYLVLWRQE